jgi:hypothetical protein
MMKTLAPALVIAAGLGGCTLGSQILDVGKECTSDAQCSEETECVRADSNNAQRVCMPFDDDEGSG